ncbi:ATP-binding protein [Ectopseudomonas guguanensis]|jgi:signal transduction histidine kinase|uniref:Histidine kinase n=1 Tax=Tilletia indica TaxID=43049 RepID=A0A8T8SAY4_9BASI|nr:MULTISPECIES: ATP-binding protein [Pseudomonas]KAE8236353.1 hypothetical protein A4X13_0g9177 [Tilletia indica]MPT18974.1 PAS domain S-box protein [Pseudomonas sp.]WJH56764.1 PAS domain S-box protein [Pseudomonas guguanensis]
MDNRQSRLAFALVEHISIGLIILDSALRIQYWNAFFDRYSGKSLVQARGQAFSEIFPEADTRHLRRIVDQASETGRHIYTHWRDNPSLIRLALPRAGHSPLILQSTLLLPFRPSPEEALHFGLVLYDATDLAKSSDKLEAAMQALSVKQLEQEQLIKKLERANDQLLQSEKLAAIGQLAAGVAHEINNPIGYVFSNLQTLAGYVHDLLRIIDAVDGAASLDDLRQLKHGLEYDYLRSDIEALISESGDGIERVKKIITSLKDFSHIEEDEFHLSDLHRGLNTTLNLVNNELKYKAEVVKDYGDLPEVECIASQINQVIMNLLVNAAQAIEQFGRITLRTGQEGDWVWLEVEDSGKGIESRLLNRIYEPFFTTKPVGKGTGLGLSLSYNIVQKHHGRIEVDSEPGRGTRFRVWLPVRQPTHTEQSPTPHE